MSIVADYRATELAIKELQAKLAGFQNDEKLQQELAFEGKVRTLMGEYGKSLKDVIAILDPQSKLNYGAKGPRAQKPAGEPSTRRQRSVKQYKNPHNGEVIETKGGNHKLLKEWKAKWGGDTVEQWATLLD